MWFDQLNDILLSSFFRGGCPVIFGDGSSGHKDSIRAISYGANGKLFVSAGDDKLVKIWTTDSWRCIYNV